MTDGTDRTVARGSHYAALMAVLLVSLLGCRSSEESQPTLPPSILRVGYGLTSGADARAGIRQLAVNIASEGLLTYGPDGRPQGRLVDNWELSDDGLMLRLHLTPGILFHDGTPVTAELVRDILLQQLPSFVGPAFGDIAEIRAVSDIEVEFRLVRRSSFLLEGLDTPIQRVGGSEANGDPIGTGPFMPLGGTEEGLVEMVATPDYHRGPPNLSGIVISQYASVRSAWADLLRQEVDMVYEVGVDAVDLLQPSSAINVFTYPRAYVLAVILNVSRPHLRDPAFRRALNAAVDRQTLVSEVLNGHGRPADGPLWPYHWAYDASLPKFTYAPIEVEGERRSFSLLFTEDSHERIALMLQRQLQAIGVDVSLESAPLDEALRRARTGDFDAFLVDAAHGPMMVRPYLIWHSKAPRNWGRFSSAAVDAAFETMQRAPSDEVYKEGVAAFQAAVIDDPPAIFLAWGERSRAVSARFDVAVEPNRDVFFSTLRLWRPVISPGSAGRN